MLAVLVAARRVTDPPQMHIPRASAAISLTDLHARSDFISIFRLPVTESIAVHTALRLPEYIVTPERDVMKSELALLLVPGYLGQRRVA
ncbi:hypothetical protein OC845_005814, partial [Tilletia horrida]